MKIIIKYLLILLVLALPSSDDFASAQTGQYDMPEIPHNVASKICKIRAAFCGDTAVAIIAASLVTFGILVISRKMDWTLALFFIIGGIMFSGVEWIALAFFSPTLVVSAAINPSAVMAFPGCVCPNNFLANILGLIPATPQDDGEPTEIDCEKAVNWNDPECSQCAGLESNPSVCSTADEWIGGCCSCEEYPDSDVCDMSCDSSALDACALSIDTSDPCCSCSELQAGLNFCSNPAYYANQDYSSGGQYCNQYCGYYSGNCTGLDCNLPQNTGSPCCP